MAHQDSNSRSIDAVVTGRVPVQHTVVAVRDFREVDSTSHADTAFRPLHIADYLSHGSSNAACICGRAAFIFGTKIIIRTVLIPCGCHQVFDGFEIVFLDNHSRALASAVEILDFTLVAVKPPLHIVRNAFLVETASCGISQHLRQSVVAADDGEAGIVGIVEYIIERLVHCLGGVDGSCNHLGRSLAVLACGVLDKARGCSGSLLLADAFSHCREDSS